MIRRAIQPIFILGLLTSVYFSYQETKTYKTEMINLNQQLVSFRNTEFDPAIGFKSSVHEMVIKKQVAELKKCSNCYELTPFSID